MTRKMFTLLLAVLLFALVWNSCGPRVNRSELDADAYFAYAKSLFDKGKYLDAITEFTVVTLKFSGTPVVDDAQFYLAESHYMNKEYLIAVAEYQKVVDDYPESPYVEKAFFKIGMSYFKLSRRPELDQEYTYKALRHFQNFIEAYPRSELRKDAEKRIAELREKLARKQLLGGNIYRKMGIYDSAIIYYDILLEKYYDTPSAIPALYYKAECQMEMGKYDEAISNFNLVIEKYPDSKYARKARRKLAKIQERLDRQQDMNNQKTAQK